MQLRVLCDDERVFLTTQMQYNLTCNLLLTLCLSVVWYEPGEKVQRKSVLPRFYLDLKILTESAQACVLNP